MRAALLLVVPLFVSTVVCAQQPLPSGQKSAPPVPKSAPGKAVAVTPVLAPAPVTMQAVAPATDDGDATDPNFPTEAQLAELACANEFNFAADKLSETKFLLHVDTQSAACKSKPRVAYWKLSSDDGLNFADLQPNEFVRTVKPVARGVEIEVIPDVRFYVYGSVPVMEGVAADSPVLTFGLSEFDAVVAATTASAVKSPVKRP